MNKIVMTTYNSYKLESKKPVIGTVIFSNRSDAEFVLEALIDEANIFDRACLHTFYSASLIPADEKDRSLGWTKEEVHKASVRCRVAPGFKEFHIEITCPHPIKTIEPYSIIPIWEDGHVTEIAKKTPPIIEGGDTNE